MKVALSHDWLNGMRGGEKCLERIGELFPESAIFTLFYDESKISDSIRRHTIFTSFLQSAPFLREFYRYYLPIFPKAIESFDLASYDLVISSSHCVAKGVRVPKQAVHICYCFTPMRYAWELFEDYFGEAKGLKRKVIQSLMGGIRKWDKASNDSVDYFVAISKHVKERISKYYNREASVIYPPVDTDFFKPSAELREPYYLIVSALVPYKRIDLAIQAFNRCKKPLVIIGDGPMMEPLKRQAEKNIQFLGWQPDNQIRQYYQKAKALIFPGEEDFGIVPVEMQACGGAVIAYRKGGALETVLENKTGVFFEKQTPENLLHGIAQFEARSWSAEESRRQAENFSAPRFKHEIRSFVQNALNQKRPSQ